MILWISCAANSWGKKQYFSGWQTLWLCNDFLSPQGDSNNHPSMHELYLLLLHLRSQGLLILPSCGRRRSYSYSLSQGNNPSHSYSQFGLPSLHVHFLGCGRKLGNQHKHKENMQTLHRKTLGPRARSHDLLQFILLWCLFPFLSLHSFPDGFPGKSHGYTAFLLLVLVLVVPDLNLSPSVSSL